MATGLRARLVLLVSIATVPALGLVLYSGVEQRRADVVRGLEDAERLAMVVAARHDALISGGHRLLLTLVQLPEVRQGRGEACSGLLREILRQQPQHANLTVIDRSGDVICSAEPVTRPVTAADTPWFQAVLERRDFVASDYHIGRVTGLPVAVLAYPVLTADGNVARVVTAPMSLAWLSIFAAGIALPPDSTLAIVDARGTILARHPDPARWVGRPAETWSVTAAIRRRHAAGVIESRDLDGRQRLFAFAPLTSTGATPSLYVAVGLARDVALSLANRSLARDLAVLGLIIAIALTAAWLGSEVIILRRLRALLDATRRLAAGDLDARAGAGHGVREIERLARTFDEMAEALRLRSAERDRAERARRESDARLAGLVHSPGIGIVRADLSGAILDANDAFLALVRYTRDDLEAGRVRWDAMTPPDPVVMADLRAHGTVTVERELGRKDGSRVHALVGATLVEDSGDEVMVFLIDLTERERHRRASASLAAVGRDLARSLDAEATARRIVEAVAEILRASFAAVYRLRPAGDLGLLAVTGGGAEFPRDFVVPGDTGLSAIALRNRTPVTSADILEDPRVVLTPESRAILEASRLRSMVCVPLLVHDAPIGTLIAADAGGRTFGEDEVALVQTFADQAAVALENARLYEEAERRRMESEALEEVAASIGASLDLDTVLQRVTEAARRLAGSDIARIALVEADGEAAVFRYWSGPHPDDLSSRRLERGKGLGGMVLATGTPARTDAYADDPRLTQDYAALVRADRTVTGLAVPIDIRGRVGGLLLVFNQSPRPFSDRDEAVLVRLASHAAIAITNAQLFDEAQRSEVRFRSLIEQGLDIITVLDADGIIRYGSPSIEHVLGYAPSALLGRAALDLVHPDDAAAVAALLRDAIPRPGHVASLEFRFRHHDGTWRVLESVGHNLLHVPAVRGIVVNSRDVTDRRVAEQALLQSEKLATMGQLLAGVAHELNNPLSVIVGHAELLGMMLASDDPRMVHAQQLAAAALRCARIVKSFLALARQRSTERQATALNDVVREAIDLLAYPLRVDSVEVALDLEPGLPDLSADPHQLHQVIVNLVTNAHHAMREVTGPRRLTIRTRSIEDGRAVRLVIGDTGPGMSPELQARIFEPFFTTKAAGQGTGLGLPLCEGIVEAHGGTITVESVVGQGTSFVITLPVEPPPTAGLAAGAGAVAPARGKSILVIDDETDVAEVIADILRPAHHVETATDGPTALAKIRARAWDVILCDVRMPGFDGPRIYREAAGSAPGVERRFAFLTGDALSPESRTFLESTAVPSLAKPFTVEDIERVVQEVLAAR